jgi:Domain of Unknown Function with PDB structure (DUF3857)/Transglutaminase-like superfamily
MNMKHIVYTVLTVLTCSTALAQSLPSASSSIKVSENEQTFTVQASGTMQLEQRLLLKALSVTGAQGLSSYALSYQQGMQSLDLLDAHTLKANGTQLPLKDADIQKSTGRLGGSTGLTYPEQHTWQLKFPDVQTGDHIFIHYRLTQLKPFMPHWHNASWFANHNLATDKLVLTLRAPKATPWFTSHKGLTLEDASTAHEQVLRYTGSVLPAPYDANAVNVSQRVAHMVASTFAKPTDVGNAFAALLHAKMLLNPEIQTIADTASAGLTAPADIAKALYDWSRKNIRYSAVYLGNGGFEPHDLSVILDKKYGDCKDHTLLLMALLKAKGIAAEPALINTGTDFSLYPIGISAYNHVIVHIPSLNLFLDGTASQAPASELPYGNRGKPVVLARLATQGGSLLHQTPPLTATQNWVETKGVFNIDAQGKLSGTATLSTQGQAAVQMQGELSKIPAGMGGMAVSQIMNKAGLRGKGFLLYDALKLDIATQTATANFEVDEYIKNTDAGSTPANPQLPGFPIYISQNIGNFIADTRSDDMRCTPISVREVFTVTYDPAFKLLRTPANASEQADTIRYTATYTRDGNTLTGTREYVDTNPQLFCTLAQYKARKVAVGKIRRNLAATVVYEQ